MEKKKEKKEAICHFILSGGSQLQTVKYRLPDDFAFYSLNCLFDTYKHMATSFTALLWPLEMSSALKSS